MLLMNKDAHILLLADAVLDERFRRR